MAKMLIFTLQLVDIKRQTAKGHEKKKTNVINFGLFETFTILFLQIIFYNFQFIFRPIH